MTMTAKGLAKLLEESGELQEILNILQLHLGRLQQIVGKKLAYYHVDDHPDGKGSIQRRLEDELADVIAASRFVLVALRLDDDYVRERVERKFKLFYSWHAATDNNEHAVDTLPKAVNDMVWYDIDKNPVPRKTRVLFRNRHGAVWTQALSHMDEVPTDATHWSYPPREMQDKV